ncbi:MAG: 2-iminoacetate synthase [Candidatus Anoxychlamydiales bacterium]|nr:2-iminoacetate synthase [Candidatus Anoxychlamydiales bacterium]
MIDENKLHLLIEKTKNRSTSDLEIEEILNKAKRSALKPSSEFTQTITLEDVATLLNVDSKNEKLMQKIFSTALDIKRMIYGNRIVLFAPLYVSNYCINSCLYCSFRAENTKIERKSLSDDEIVEEVKALQRQGHKRLVMLMGEHPKYSLDDFIRHIHLVANVKSKPFGSIRRVNIEIPALNIDEFKKLKATNEIGTYILFQETYHRKTFEKMHTYGPKSDYDWRLDTMSRALQAGVDDVGIGALFGLYDYRFEVLALLEHARFLDETFSIGPHTISVPRIKKAENAPCSTNVPYPVNDLDFKKLVAIIRIVVPYTGIILSTRESPEIRKEIYKMGVSQISAGSKTDIGGYKNKTKDVNEKSSSQFSLADERPTSEVIHELIELGFIPSWCTACYRSNRTGKNFMDIAKKGEIQNLCHPNALITFAEYLLDYADEKTKKIGWNLIEEEKSSITNESKKNFLEKALEKTKNDTRDLYI